MNSVSVLIKYPWSYTNAVFEMKLSRACAERLRRVHYRTFYNRKRPFSNQLLLLEQASDSEFFAAGKFLYLLNFQCVLESLLLRGYLSWPFTLCIDRRPQLTTYFAVLGFQPRRFLLWPVFGTKGNIWVHPDCFSPLLYSFLAPLLCFREIVYFCPFSCLYKSDGSRMLWSQDFNMELELELE